MSDLVLDVVQQALNGFLFGSSYALIGIGFTMIFGVMEKLNLAFGVTALGGAYLALLVFQLTRGPFVLVFLAAVAAAGVIGLVVELACFHWTPRDYPLAALMATVGMLFFIEEVIVHATDGMPRAFPAPLGQLMLDAGPWLLRGDLTFMFLMSLVVMAALWLLVYRTRLGLATRAVSQQPVAAQLCGLGSIPGAIVGGLLLGIVEYEALYFFGIGYRDMVTYFLLFAFLVFRPGGLFGPRAGG